MLFLDLQVLDAGNGPPKPFRGPGHHIASVGLVDQRIESVELRTSKIFSSSDLGKPKVGIDSALWETWWFTTPVVGSKKGVLVVMCLATENETEAFVEGRLGCCSGAGLEQKERRYIGMMRVKASGAVQILEVLKVHIWSWHNGTVGRGTSVQRGWIALDLQTLYHCTCWQGSRLDVIGHSRLWVMEIRLLSQFACVSSAFS